jgi:hypothetical protein
MPQYKEEKVMEITLKQGEFFRILQEHNLTPNMYYDLYQIYTGIKPKGIHMELIPGAEMLDDNWLIIGKDDKLHLTHKSVELLKKIETLFGKVKVKKINARVADPEFESNVSKFREMFPAIKLPSKAFARQSVKDLMKAFAWYFEEYDHDWDTIFKATGTYVDEYEMKDWMYFRKSQYFIRKNNESWLSEYCDALLGGIEPDKPHTFNEKVV